MFKLLPKSKYPTGMFYFQTEHTLIIYLQCIKGPRGKLHIFLRNCSRKIQYCELPISFNWGNDVYSCSSGRYSFYVLSVINSNYIELIFHLIT